MASRYLVESSGVHARRYRDGQHASIEAGSTSRNRLERWLAKSLYAAGIALLRLLMEDWEARGEDGEGGEQGSKIIAGTDGDALSSATAEQEEDATNCVLDGWGATVAAVVWECTSWPRMVRI